MLDRPSKLALALRNICYAAGDEIMRIYVRPELWQAEDKDDASPVTAADLAANRVICEGLAKLVPRLPVLTEEEVETPWSVRRQWARYWLVDPLDGTKEFLERNGEFSVNIAFIEHGVAKFGLVYLPVQGLSYFGGRHLGSYVQSRDGQAEKLEVQPLDWDNFRLLTSHRHQVEELAPLVDHLKSLGAKIQQTPMGSSLKLCQIAAGQADFYPRLGLTSEWDTAAGQAVIEGAGGRVLDWSFRPLTYNQKTSLLNPEFMVVGDLKHPWQEWLAPFVKQQETPAKT